MAKSDGGAGVGPGSKSAMVYAATWGWLALALAFPIGLMIFDPTLMFRRGWEQFAGTAIYFAALVLLGKELFGLGANERTFSASQGWIGDDPVTAHRRIEADDDRVLPKRLRQLSSHADAPRPAPLEELMTVQGEASALDQEQAAGRFTLTRYILYLLPVIGFIGTVRGISEALKEIGPALKEVNNLASFLANLDRVTSALQIAFDSTLLALFLSAALMFIMTLVHRRSEDFLARVDRWVIERVLPRLCGRRGDMEEAERFAQALRPDLSRLEQALSLQADRTQQALLALGAGLAPQVERFADSIDRVAPALDRLAPSLDRFEGSAVEIAKLHEHLATWSESVGRIERLLAGVPQSHDAVAEMKAGLDRANDRIEDLSRTLAEAFDRASRTTQEHLAQSLVSLKDALDMLQVSIEQSNVLYRSIVKKIQPAGGDWLLKSESFRLKSPVES